MGNDNVGTKDRNFTLRSGTRLKIPAKMITNTKAVIQPNPGFFTRLPLSARLIRCDAFGHVVPDVVVVVYVLISGT